MTDPLFQNFSGVLKCEFKYGDQGDIRSYYFHTQDSLSEASENYTNPEFVKTELEKNYNSLKERIRIQTEIEDEKETMESVTEEYPPLEKNKLNAFEILFENILSEEFEDYTYGFNAKGNFYAILEDGETEFGEHGIVQYDIRIVFDRVDDNGNHLFVQNICYYQEDGNARSELSTGIMERYAVNLEEKTAE